MVSEHLLRWPDLVAIGINLSAMVAIGVYTARRNRSADAYFLANRSMPGWIVGFSLMATIISSMTFLAIPGFTFEKDWRYMPAHFFYFIPAIVAYFLFMPYFRRGHVRSAYEYLELRFGTWARLYAATGFLVFQMFRTGVILYAVCLPFGPMTGLPLGWVILVLGILVAAYTIAGGLEAVIYTDLLQGLALIAGGLICIPLAVDLIPGGLSQVFAEAVADGKFAVGSTGWAWDDQTVWVLILVYQFIFFQLLCTDQNAVQRYIAMKTDRDAKLGLVLSTVMTIPVWLYFAFIGTVLYVYYKHFPAAELDSLVSEQAFPYFVLTQIPAGAAGFVLSGLLAAAMSTLDSGINASAATITNDFYRRFKKSVEDEQHYLKFGRWVSVAFGVIMISSGPVHTSRPNPNPDGSADPGVFDPQWRAAQYLPVGVSYQKSPQPGGSDRCCLHRFRSLPLAVCRLHHGDSSDARARGDAAGQVLDRCVFQYLPVRAGLPVEFLSAPAGNQGSAEFDRLDLKGR